MTDSLAVGNDAHVRAAPAIMVFTKALNSERRPLALAVRLLPKDSVTKSRQHNFSFDECLILAKVSLFGGL